jgi:hypothetical protein
MTLLASDPGLTLENAGDRRDFLKELFQFLRPNLPRDLDPTTAAPRNVDELKSAIHKLHGAVRYYVVQRVTKAIEKLELVLQHGKKSEVEPLLNLLNGEATALNT